MGDTEQRIDRDPERGHDPARDPDGTADHGPGGGPDGTADHGPGGGPDFGPDFGPGGYLPGRAAKRARKIVLREQMGLVWVIAAAVAAVAVAAVGGFYLMVQAAPPGAPFVAVAPITDFDPRGVEAADVDGTEVLVVRAGGGVRAFLPPDADVAYCAESRRLEATDGSVWDVRGQRTGGDGASLRPLPSAAHDDVLYVNPEEPLPPPEPAGVDERPVCE